MIRQGQVMVSLVLMTCRTQAFMVVSPLNMPSRHQYQMRLFGRGKNKAENGRFTKSNLPSKICVVCGRPFEWRKKWERCWEEVTTCSKSCNAQRRSINGKNNKKEQDL